MVRRERAAAIGLVQGDQGINVIGIVLAMLDPLSLLRPNEIGHVITRQLCTSSRGMIAMTTATSGNMLLMGLGLFYL